MARRMMLTPGESGEYNAEEINDNGRFVESHREERPSQWVDENTGGIVNRRDMGWNELADQQRANAEMEQINANRKAFDQYVAIEDGAKQQKLALDHQRAIAGAAMIQSAARNGGMSDRSLSAAFSQAFGRPVSGGQLVKDIDIGNGPETVLVMYDTKINPKTGRIPPVAMMGSRDMLQILKQAGLGDTTNDLQNRIIDNSYLGKLTDDQRAAMGVSRPSAPISTGTTVISGSAMRALRGQGRTRAPISVFSNVGADGRIGSGTTSKTIYPDGTVVDNSTGTNSPDWNGWSKLQFQVGDTQTFKNKFTGEVVDVPKGETLANVLRGTSEKEKVAQIQAQGRENAAQTQAQARISAEESKLRQNRERQYNSWLNTQMNALNRKLDGMRRATTGVTNQPRWSNEEIDKTEREGLAAIEQRGQDLFADIVGGQPAATQQKQGGGQAQASSGDNTNTKTDAKDEIREDKNGVKWRIIRDKNGKAIGKQRV